MSNAIYKKNVSAYEKKFKGGYGLQYPDGHVIRFYHRILEHEFKLKKGRVLDYGCGSGVHLKFFLDHGLTPFGCDISQDAITKCKMSMPEYEDQFFVTPSVPRLSDYFKAPFDLVFSNQVLYYLSDEDLRNMVVQLYNLTRPGGIFFATMMPPTNRYFHCIQGKEGDLSKVVLSGRLNETTYINFKNPEELSELFSPFRKVHLGYYSELIREEEGLQDHYIFVGLKD